MKTHIFLGHSDEDGFWIYKDVLFEGKITAMEIVNMMRIFSDELNWEVRYVRGVKNCMDAYDVIDDAEVLHV